MVTDVPPRALLRGSSGPLASAAETVLTFLESMGRRSEAELYLGLFRQLPRESFAVVGVGNSVMRHALGSFAEQQRFLADLGLFAPVASGLLDKSPAPSLVDRLCRRLSGLGLQVEEHSAEQADLAGALASALRAERTPILRFEDPFIEFDERLDRVGQLMRDLGTRKLVLLRRRGGLGAGLEPQLQLAPGHWLEVHAGGVSTVNLRTDFAALRTARKLGRDDMRLLLRLRSLLSSHPGLMVNVASPFNLLAELFTVRGAGTLVKAGSDLLRPRSYAAVDLESFKRLLESSFGKPLRSEFFERQPLAIYLEAKYRAAAVLEPGDVAPFLTKFAVDPAAQGEGIGRDLWEALVRDHPSVFWRARPTNPIAAWYARVCDGMLRLQDWHVYWRGLQANDIPRVVDEAVSRPTDF